MFYGLIEWLKYYAIYYVVASLIILIIAVIYHAICVFNERKMFKRLDDRKNRKNQQGKQ